MTAGKTIAALGGLVALAVLARSARSAQPKAVALVRWPIDPGLLTSVGDSVGAERSHGMHRGLDLFAPAGTAVLAPVGLKISTVTDGSLSNRAAAKRAGLFIVAVGEDGRQHRFAHLMRPLVRPGDSVKAGDRLAQVAEAGTSGAGARSHLHWEVWAGGRAVDARELLAPINLSVAAWGRE